MNSTPTTPPLSEIFHALLAAGWRRRYLILLPLLLLPILGGLVGSFVPHSYETRMSVLVQEPGRFNPFLEDLSVRSNLRDRMDGLRALLTSRHVLLGVAEDLGMIQPGATESEQSRAVGSLSRSVSVQLIGQEMVELRYRARRPEGMDRVLAQVGQRFIERVRGPEDASLRDSVAFLGGQIQDAQNALNQSEQALSSFKSTHAARLPDMRAANLQRLAQMREQLADREVRLAGAEAEINSISSRLLQTDPVLGRLEQDIVATRGELALLRSRYTDAHSRVQAVLNRAESLEQERDSLLARSGVAMDDARLRNIAAVSVARADGAQPLLVSQIAILDQARARLGQLRGETENLRATVADLSRHIAGSGEVERELRGLERDVAVQADLVQQLRRRFETARVTADLARQQAPERIKVIDRPFEPTAPTKPMTMIFALAGIAAGLALGIGLAALFELMDGSVRGIRTTEKLLGVPVLARLPRVERKLAA
jgi:polysaccharide chain length determinant protein (PEP-CTERM system associated)